MGTAVCLVPESGLYVGVEKPRDSGSLSQRWERKRVKLEALNVGLKKID